ncbi:uncharacterized protein [Hyperolius riggenbachi]
MNKWRSVRDTYKKELTKLKKLERSGSGSIPTPSYKHFQMMSFLRPCYEARRTEDSFGDSQNADLDSNSSVASNSDNADDGTERASYSGSATTSSTASRRRERSTRATTQRRVTSTRDEDTEEVAHLSTTYKDILDYLKSTRDRQIAYEESVPLKILTSLKPYLDDVHPRYYSSVHVELIQVIEKYQRKTRQDNEGKLGTVGGSSTEGSVCGRELHKQGNYQQGYGYTNTMGPPNSASQQFLTEQTQTYTTLPPPRSRPEVNPMYNWNETLSCEHRSLRPLERHSEPSASQPAPMSMTRLLYDFDGNE